MSESTIKVPAIRMVQNGRVLYALTIAAKRLSEVASVSQLAKDEEGKVFGYQRGEVTAHIQGIKKYLEGPTAILPNAIILALNGEAVEFEVLNKKNEDLGHLTFKLNGEAKPSYVVDGQQRAASLRDATLADANFPVCCIAFIPGSEAEEKEQFVLVNSARPLPKSLIYELLPSMGKV